MSLHRSEIALLGLYALSAVGMFLAKQAAEQDPGGASFAGLILVGILVPTLGSVVASSSIWVRRSVSWTIAPLAAWMGYLAAYPLTAVSWAEGNIQAILFAVLILCFMALLFALPFFISLARASRQAWRVAVPFFGAALVVLLIRLLGAYAA